MEAKQKYLFPLLVFFLLFAFSSQAISSPIIEKNDVRENIRAAFREVRKVVGPPNYAADDHAEWMLRAVNFMLEKIGWKYHFSGEGKPDAKEIQNAKGAARRVILWLIERLKLNPYRRYGGFLFFYLFYYVKNMEQENPDYPCFKAVYPPCMARAPATPEGEVVYEFECAWKLNEKCLKPPWDPLVN